MDNVQSNDTKPNAVEVVGTGGEWFVHVVENGEEIITSFELEAYAMGYAEGQRIPFGLEKVVRT